MSDKIALVKLAINVFAGAGVSKVVNDIITNNTVVETPADAVKVFAGSAVIGSMVAERASDHVNNKVDKVVDWFEQRKAEKATAE